MRALVIIVLLALSCELGLADEDWLRVGDAAFARCDVAEAIKAYRAARENDPKNYEATWKLARSINDHAQLLTRSEQQKKFFLEAQSLAQEAVRLNPKGAKGFLYLAITEGNVALFEGGKKKVELSKDVKARAEKALELNPQEDLAYHVLGIWHREMATLNAVLKFFAQVIYGKFPPASLDGSVANFKKAIELDDTAIGHRFELGLTYMEQKKREAARSEFEKVLKLPKRFAADDNYLKQARVKLEEVKKRPK